MVRGGKNREKAEVPKAASKSDELRAWRQEMKNKRKRGKLYERKEKSRAGPKHGDKGTEPRQPRQQLQKKTSIPEAETSNEKAGTPQKLLKKREHVEAEVDDANAQGVDIGEPRQKKPRSGATGGAEVVTTDPEAFKVVVAGMPLNVEEAIIRRDFSDCGEIVGLRLLKHRDTRASRGIAFISFTTQAAVDEALKFHGTSYGGRSLLVEVAASNAKGQAKVTGKTPHSLGEKPIGCTSVLLKGLAFSVTDADLRRLFEACGGGPANINILTDRETGASRGMAFVDFDDEATVDEAIKLNGTELKGRRFSMDYATPRVKTSGPGEKPPNCTSVVVKGLDYSVTEERLRRLFRKCGDGPTNVRMAMGKDGKSRGIGFVDFACGSAVDEAIKLHGKELEGRCLVLDFAMPRSEEGEGAAGKKQKGPGKKPPGCTSVTVNNLSAAVTEKRLVKTFATSSGAPRSVNIVLTETGEPSGTAFVNFYSETAVDEAMQLNGTELKGQCITMGYVKPKPPKSKNT